MSVLSPTAKMQFTDITGAPLVGGLLYTYAAGTTTPLATYTDSSGNSANSNPVVLDARGEANIWLGANTYKFTLKDADDNLIWTVDNISAPTSSLSPVLSGNVFISSASSSPALTIQQTGTGNLVRFQNTSNPAATPAAVIASSGWIGVGVTTPTAPIDVARTSGALQISESGSAVARLFSDNTNTVLTAEGARNMLFFTDSALRIAITSGATVVYNTLQIPVAPVNAIDATNKTYVDTLTTAATTAAAPPGSVMAFAGASVPTGWLGCLGQPLSTTTYAALFAAIGYSWGGSGASFLLPDLRGAFLRGVGAGLNPVPRAVGSYEADGNLSHTHTATQADHKHTSQYPALSLQTVGGSTVNISYFTGGTNSPDTSTVVGGPPAITVASSGNVETTVKNFGVLYIIKT